jgi:dTDP-4-dehydrorhamnose reductase
MDKILVTGADGQLGRELRVLADAISGDPSMRAHPGYEFVFAGRDLLPLDNEQGIREFFAANHPVWCINCAAYTAVDKAESDKDAAFRINGDAVGWLATACRDAGARLIHISTDYVFDGQSPSPLKEKDPTSPINVYGASKLEGERQAFQQYPEGTLIIRTAWVYSEFGANFVKTMIRLMKERPSINVVDDQIGSPTYAADLAAAILHIIGSSKFVPGVFHYSDEGRISWYEFALAIHDAIGSPCTVNPIPTVQYPTPAKRPHYSLLDKTRIRETYNLTIPEWRTSLLACLRKLGFAGN